MNWTHHSATYATRPWQGLTLEAEVVGDDLVYRLGDEGITRPALASGLSDTVLACAEMLASRIVFEQVFPERLIRRTGTHAYVAVCGGREVPNDSPTIRAISVHLERAYTRTCPMTLVHGACPTGVDYWASRWATLRGVRQKPHPADWKRHGRAAGPIRNREMARSGLTACIAFPGGRGTASMVRECEAAGVAVWMPLGTIGRGRTP